MFFCGHGDKGTSVHRYMGTGWWPRVCSDHGVGDVHARAVPQGRVTSTCVQGQQGEGDIHTCSAPWGQADGHTWPG